MVLLLTMLMMTGRPLGSGTGPILLPWSYFSFGYQIWYSKITANPSNRGRSQAGTLLFTSDIGK
jgi:hypothetical protein